MQAETQAGKTRTMAKVSSSEEGVCSTAVMLAAHDADAASGEVRVTVSGGADDKVKRKQLKRLNRMVFWIAMLEWTGNAVGTLAFLWATVVMLGGFSSLLSGIDFWFSTVMVFVEGTRVFIRSDASVNQWLFGSTRAFKWDDFSFPRVEKHGNLIAMLIGAGISLAPVKFQPEIAAGILKVALLVITSQLLTRRQRGWFVRSVLNVFMLAAFCGLTYGYYIIAPHKVSFKRAVYLANLKFTGIFMGWFFGTVFLAIVTSSIMFCIQEFGKPSLVLCSKVAVASGLACLPFLQAKPGSKYKYLSISIAVALLAFNYPSLKSRNNSSSSETSDSEEDNLFSRVEQTNTLLLETSELFLEILDTILPILFFWGVVFPLPGISLKTSFYMLLSVIAAVLVDNLQIPVAFLQVLLSSLRLRSLLGPNPRAYHPLPDGASPNLVPSIVVFFMLELCQGSTYIMGVILGLVSFRCRRSLVRALGFTQEWGAKAVNLYHHHVYKERTEKGLFPTEKYRPPSIDNFAIESLGSTSNEMQIVRLCVLDYYLQLQESESKKKLVTEIGKDAAGIITKVIGIINSLITDLLENSVEDTNDDEQQEKVAVICSSLCLSVNFVRRLATTAGKIGSRFRQELWENPLLLNSLERIMELEASQPELLELVMDLIAMLALDNAVSQEIGSSQGMIDRLMGAYLSNNHLRTAAGGALVNLTIISTDNCWAILKAEPGHNLIKNLVAMLDLEDEKHICIAANLLHNLCANSGDMLIDHGAKEDLESALPKVMEIIKTKEGKQLEAALNASSKIRSVIPNCFCEVHGSYTNAEAEELVKKLVDTLSSNREPCPEYPRIRRALVEMIISIVNSCPDPYKSIFRKLGVNNVLDMVKGTSSRLEKYMVFIAGEGIVLESSPLRDLVDEARRLFVDEATPTQGAQPGSHA